MVRLQPTGQGPDLDVQMMADKLFDSLPEVGGKQSILAETTPGMVDQNLSDPDDVRSASAIITIRESAVNLQNETRDRGRQSETMLEGIMSHEIGHAAHITGDYSGFGRGQTEARTNKTPYRDKETEKIANAASHVIIFERQVRGHIRTSQPNVRWPIRR